MSQNPDYYPENDGKTQDIGHCHRCKFQWVIAAGAKGKNYPQVKGRVCPFCKCERIYYTKEDNR